ncbi:MBL fold metallo-hydrolase [Acidiluteibacter ferrifornacis]|uniref:MBL fold metallo-hydrolase n=1 Tax=Acidiluteibacter ferrifornacis TaxID=2692424 RepID=A0A6N9NMC9_9FLAO|nr:MBL fold metallo-hydrolase [Acidiluteibacter ferrifornacis]NBG66380.1 MBL fold metallo-hydrolase [Acidiluteibacter ferrifornacis]
MVIEQIYTGCLAQGAYYIESNGEAVIIDPLREVDDYIKKAEKNGAQIKYIFETHFHADFVSGHVTLAEKTGATIVYGPNANPSFDALIAEDNQVFKVGDITLTALHTPGHTLESTTYLLKDESGKDIAIFSGDTLFLGDVGRPDLAQKMGSITQDDLAGMLFDSLRNKIMPLADDVTVYPAHGAGSSCGKNMMKETVDTLGNQKKMNYALRADMTKEEFIKEVTDGLLPPPAYFPLNVKMNKEGYVSIDTVMEKGQTAMSPNDFEQAANATSAIVLDVRHQDEYAKGHIPQSIFIGLDGQFAPWVGAIIGDVKQQILLVAPEGRVEEAITRLARVGFDQIIGFLDGGFDAWKTAEKEIDTVESIDVDGLRVALNVKPQFPIVDVRKESEYATCHLPTAKLIPLDDINSSVNDFPQEPFYLHCAGGYRSMIAISILKARGNHNAIDIKGGFGAIKQSGITYEAIVN